MRQLGTGLSPDAQHGVVGGWHGLVEEGLREQFPRPGYALYALFASYCRQLDRLPVEPAMAVASFKRARPPRFGCPWRLGYRKGMRMPLSLASRAALKRSVLASGSAVSALMIALAMSNAWEAPLVECPPCKWAACPRESRLFFRDMDEWCRSYCLADMLARGSSENTGLSQLA